MIENQAAVLPRTKEISTAPSADPIKKLTDVEEAIRYLVQETEISAGPLGTPKGKRFLSTIATTDVLEILETPEAGAPKKRGRRPSRKTFDGIAQKKTRSTDANWDKRKGVKRRRQVDPTTCERDYSEDEVEFMKALDLYKKLNERPFPTCSETLEVLRRLGYVKMPPVSEGASCEPILVTPASCSEGRELCEFVGVIWQEGELTTFII
ncbi:MAG: hypothetical protein ACOX6D_08540 [Thermoguttaceae bacterium]|jgi:hypothetical protein